MIALVFATLVSASLPASSIVRADRETSDIKQAYARPAALSEPGVLATDKIWALGQTLFFDPRLSASATLSCASCHKPDQSWSDHRSKPIGEAHKPLAFRAPTLLNAGQIDRYGWTGRFPDVEAVSFFAMTSPTNWSAP